MCLARDVMTINPSTCRENHTVYDAVRIMKREDCGVVPVVDELDRCIGIVTDRDICLHAILEHLDPEETPLSHFMSTDVVTCKETDDIETVLDIMEREQIRRIPVINDDDALTGIISEGDLARSEVKAKVSELVEAVVQ